MGGTREHLPPRVVICSPAAGVGARPDLFHRARLVTVYTHPTAAVPRLGGRRHRRHDPVPADIVDGVLLRRGGKGRPDHIARPVATAGRS